MSEPLFGLPEQAGALFDSALAGDLRRLVARLSYLDALEHQPRGLVHVLRGEKLSVRLVER